MEIDLVVDGSLDTVVVSDQFSRAGMSINGLQIQILELKIDHSITFICISHQGSSSRS